MDEIELEEAQQSLDELLGQNSFSLKEAVISLMTGEIPFSLESIKQLAADAFWGELKEYRTMAAYLLVILVASAVFSNFMTVFDKEQIADISGYMMYLLMVTLLMKAFSSMSQVAAGAVAAILQFMKALLPACFMTVFFSSGSLSAMGLNQATLLAISVLQWMMGKLLLPAVQIYVILLFVNQMMKEDYLSKMADLVKTLILWALKTTTAVLLGLQAVQCMMAPAADRLKTSALGKAVSMVPGIGDAYETVAETVLGSAVLLKNAVGVVGLAAILLIGLVPVIKLGFAVLLYRLLGAAAQPVAEKRTGECISSVAEGGELLLKIVIYAGVLFIVSLAMMASMIQG